MGIDQKQWERARSSTAAEGAPISNALIQVTRMHMMVARQLLKRLGLHPGQELLLMHLWDSGAQRQSVLASIFATDSAAMTRTVQRLENAGLVERRSDPTDGRATLVAATAASQLIRQGLENVWTELESLTVRDMTEEDQERLMTGLIALEKNLSAVITES
ncbi:MarR family winged helix-turn-helix transcriptional regulator [Leifsonia sp. NPDC058248]|uniref:MarR family winged helix-turn-helix transcriptional regulator n=1 Tax=Leifsonia sp. NPDC058248 TaxID=3346402 RepID=UPI0036DE1174